MDEKRKKFGGRKPGSKNLVQRNVKALIEQAFIRSGGIDEFVKWAEANRTEFYTKLLGKLVPKEIRAEIEQPGSQVVIFLPDNGRGDSQEPPICLPAEREAC